MDDAEVNSTDVIIDMLMRMEDTSPVYYEIDKEDIVKSIKKYTVEYGGYLTQLAFEEGVENYKIMYPLIKNQVAERVEEVMRVK